MPDQGLTVRTETTLLITPQALRVSLQQILADTPDMQDRFRKHREMSKYIKVRRVVLPPPALLYVMRIIEDAPVHQDA